MFVLLPLQLNALYIITGKAYPKENNNNSYTNRSDGALCISFHNHFNLIPLQIFYIANVFSIYKFAGH